MNTKEKYNSTVYFDSNQYYSILPYSLFRKIIDKLFTSENIIYCEEVSDGELIRYICNIKGIAIIAKNKGINCHLLTNLAFYIIIYSIYHSLNYIFEL